ncbi:MAG TPA: hypothetical protein VD862_03965 [Candidatus Paceibacterota bacterium]|nr:hypothetical protein [Candidatus Paceibacterota bacterium]
MAISLQVRRLLFWAAVIIFGIAAYVAVLYAQGYEFSFRDRRFVRTGAVTLDANAQADVFIDGEHAGGTFLIGDTFSRGRLLPGTYEFRMERDGYSTWTKTVQVQEGLVTDFPRVLILQTDETIASRSRGLIDELMEVADAVPSPTPTPAPSASAGAQATPSPVPYALVRGVLTVNDERVATGVLGYRLSGDGAKLMWFTRNEVVVRWLTDSDEQPFRTAGDQVALLRLTTVIDGAVWWPDAYHVAVRSGSTYHIVELDDRGGTNIIRF